MDRHFSTRHPVAIPTGLPPWIVEFIRDSTQQNDVLIENGANQAATARSALLNRLVAAAAAHLETDIDVEQAAALTGRHPETIRRAIRAGAIPDRRTNPRGHHKVRRSDLDGVAGRIRAPYDPIADARAIARLKKPR